MKQNNITLNLTDKEFEIVRRALLCYTNKQIGLSQTFGTTEEDDAPAIRAMISAGIESKCYKKTLRNPELQHILIF